MIEHPPTLQSLKGLGDQESILTFYKGQKVKVLNLLQSFLYNTV